MRALRVTCLSREPKATCSRGFTLVEMLVTVVIVAVLASAVFPLTHLAHKRTKEAQLRHSLEQIRAAIDAYKRAADSGHIILKSGESGYPPNLQVLMDGVVDARPGAVGATGNRPNSGAINGVVANGLVEAGAVANLPAAENSPSGTTGKTVSAPRIYFLRHIPRDPMNEDTTLSAAETWGLRSYASSYEEPKVGVDVFDVYSKSTVRGMNDQPYNTW